MPPLLRIRDRLRAAPAALWIAAAACGGGGDGSASAIGAEPSAGGASAAQGPAWFSEEARGRGLDFVHVSGHEEGRYLMPEIMAGGAALVDVEGDGDLDAYFVQAGVLGGDRSAAPGNELFLNDGAGRFQDATEGSGAADRSYGMGVACGDADGDGRVDLYVTNIGPNVLLRNLGAGRFEDVTESARVGLPGFGSSAAFFDHAADGDLDLVALNYLHWSLETELECFNQQGSPDYCSPQAYENPALATFYRNLGGGRFEEATQAVGLDRAIGNGLGVMAGDFNADGIEDLFVANDGMPNHMWIGQSDGAFREDAVFSGVAVDQDGRAKAGMGVAAADVDDDADLDLIVCNLANQTDSFFLNQGGVFRDATSLAGLGMASRPFTRFGMGWVDFDQDGWLDLYQANGRVNRQSRLFGEDPFAEPNLLFRGEGARFREVLPRGGTAELRVATSRAAAFGDVDGDGAVDVLVVNKDAPAHLLMNVVPGRGGWIRLRAVEPTPAGLRDCLGATITLRAGARTLRRDARAAYSYQASSDPAVHVGLGALERIEDVIVRWPGGAREAFGAFDAGQVVTLVRGSGKPVE